MRVGRVPDMATHMEHVPTRCPTWLSAAEQKQGLALLSAVAFSLVNWWKTKISAANTYNLMYYRQSSTVAYSQSSR